MRKYSKKFIFSLFLASIIFPFFPVTVKAQVSDVFVIGAVGPRDIAHWDTPTFVTSTGDYYMWSTLEVLFRPQEQTWGGDVRTELLPVLATSWTIEDRPDEMNVAGFMSSGGMKSVEVTLRQGVKFHDGSDWNATVLKWNLDRIMTILGNISGVLPSADSNVRTARDTYWMQVADWEDLETPNWNVTQFAGIPASYPGWGVSGDLTSRFPRFYNITITQDLQSGGKVKINFGDWATGMNYLRGIEMISMDTYKDYFDTIIFGYGDHPSFPQDNPAVFPGHLIGTGPYVFGGHVSDIGTLTRFEDWWNSSAQQADGWHMVDNVAVATFAHTEAGYQARSTAMVTGDIDWAYDRSWEPLNYEDMIAAPNVRYEPFGVGSYGENIILNSINETTLWLMANVLNSNMSATWAPFKPSFVASGVMNPDGTFNAHGINRAFRKAISYAFDYDTYVHVALNDRVARSGGFLCGTSPFYNASIPIAYHNLTIARQTLLDDPFWGPILADRQLDITNTTAEWNHIADTNPIYNMEYSWDQAHLEAYSVITTSLRDIGCGIDASEDVPSTYYKMSTTFTFPWTITDGFALKLYYPRVNALGYLEAYYKSPSGATPIWPYDQFYNMGFSYNTTFDDEVKKIWVQDDTENQKSYNLLTDWIQNYQYPTIFLGNDLIGHAVDNDWDYSWFWGTFRFNLVKYIGAGPEIPLIPGFPVIIVVPATILAIYYTIRRKKRFMQK
ncbi:MAG: ABC transporter substrate-binding protein [Candidatus Thorarchaeota archaeon]